MLPMLILALSVQAEDLSQGAAQCLGGMASQFTCNSVHLQSVIDLRGDRILTPDGNDVWGWTDPLTGKEYALMGLTTGTAFVDISEPTQPRWLGWLETHSRRNTWRDIKVYQNHAFIVSEARRHGMQVFDLTQLRDLSGQAGPIEFQSTAHYSGFSNAHNIVINEDTGYGYAVGTNTCDRGMHVMDLRVPTQPTFVTCIDKTIFEALPGETRPMHGEDYTHDAQCVVYQGPDVEHLGKEICVASNADTVNIVDLHDKLNPTQISVTGYGGLGYTHQGWLTEDHRYFLLGDELDELNFKHPTKTLIWDVSDLESPRLVGTYFGTTYSIDHNLYIKGNYAYQANYQAGLRILDLTNIGQGRLTEAGFFDIEPEKDDTNFEGAWSVYPYFESGNVLISDIGGRLFVVKPSL